MKYDEIWHLWKYYTNVILFYKQNLLVAKQTWKWIILLWLKYLFSKKILISQLDLMAYQPFYQIPQNSWTGASLSNGLVSCPRHFGEVLLLSRDAVGVLHSHIRLDK